LLFLRFGFGVFGLEGVGDILEKDQTQDDVLVFGGVHVVAERGGGGPELGFKAEISTGIAAITSRPFCFFSPLPYSPPVCSIIRRLTAWRQGQTSGKTK